MRQRGGDLRAAPTVYGATFSAMDPLQATIEDFAAEGYTHIESSCPRCRVIRLRPIEWLPRILMGRTVARHRRACEPRPSQGHP